MLRSKKIRSVIGWSERQIGADLRGPAVASSRHSPKVERIGNAGARVQPTVEIERILEVHGELQTESFVDPRVLGQLHRFRFDCEPAQPIEGRGKVSERELTRNSEGGRVEVAARQSRMKLT